MSFDRLFFIILNVFNTFIAAYFVDGFLKKRSVDPALYAGALLFHYTSIAAVYLLLGNVYLNSAVNIVAILALAMCYAAPMRSRLLCTAFLIVFGIAAETLTLAVVALVTVMRPVALMDTPIGNVIGHVISKLLLFAIVKLMLLFQKRERSSHVPLTYWITVIAFPIGSIYILLAMLTILLNGAPDMDFRFMLAIPIILLVMNGMMYIVYDKLEEGYRIDQQRALLARQNAYYEQQAKQALYNDRQLLALRHDMKNQLITFLEYANGGKLSELHALGARLLGELDRTVSVADAGIPAIDALINYKAAYALQQGIAVKAHLSIPNDLEVDTIDIATLLGNMLDNAIDACMRLQTGRDVKVLLSYSQCALRICVENTYDGLALREGNGFRSTKQDAKNHGYGLDAIRSVVDKYQGSLIIDTRGNLFVVDALLTGIVRQGSA